MRDSTKSTEESASQAMKLYPTPVAYLPISEVHASLYAEFQRPKKDGLPVVIMNMVSSIDGATSVDGRATGLGSRSDRQVMNNLRSQVDAVMIGANTLRAEKYSMKLPDHLSEKRRLRGQRRAPWLVIPTSTADLPTDNLISSPPTDTVLLTSSTLGFTSHALSDHILTVDEDDPAESPGTFDWTRALRSLRADYDVQTLLVEGGPSLNGHLVKSRLVDQLFLTIAPKLLGGGGTGSHQTILQGENLRPTHDARLLTMHAIDHEIFLRYDLSQTPK